MPKHTVNKVFCQSQSCNTLTLGNYREAALQWDGKVDAARHIIIQPVKIWSHWIPLLNFYSSSALYFYKKKNILLTCRRDLLMSSYKKGEILVWNTFFLTVVSEFLHLSFPVRSVHAVVAPLWWPGWGRTDGRLRWLVSLFSRVAEQPTLEHSD